MAEKTAFQAPSTPRNESWQALSGPSTEKEQAITPASLSSFSRSCVTNIPHGARTLLIPIDVAWRTSSDRSLRIMGSPPVQIIIGLKADSESSTRRHSAAESSPPQALIDAEARQCRHFIGHRRVTSQAKTFGIENSNGLLSNCWLRAGSTLSCGSIPGTHREPSRPRRSHRSCGTANGWRRHAPKLRPSRYWRGA